jgi:hypothetical protein
LKEELFGCFKYIHIPYSELMTMPTRDRKYYIRKHNETAEEERKRNGTMELGGDNLNGVADMSLHRRGKT